MTLEVKITREVKNYFCTKIGKDCVGANRDGCPGWKVEYQRLDEDKGCKYQKIEILEFKSLDEMRKRFPSTFITDKKGTVI